MPEQPELTPTGDELYREGPGVGTLMTRLATQRPAFHGEADFLHHVAWALRGLDPRLSIRLESRPLPGEPLQLDLLLAHPSTGERVAVELRYPTRPLHTIIGEEIFDLRAQTAPDLLRYDVVRDIARLERLVAAGAAHRGWALVLTNEPALWTAPTRDGVDADFRVHDGRRLSGTLAWLGAGAGVPAGRRQALTLAGHYPLAWREFAALPTVEGGRFRYLAVAVGAPQRPVPAPRGTTEREPDPAPRDRDGRPGPAEHPDIDRLVAMREQLHRLQEGGGPGSDDDARSRRCREAVHALDRLIAELRAEGG